MNRRDSEPAVAWELIPDAEPALTVREFDRILAKTGLLTRSQRTALWKALRAADLLVFRA